MIGGEVVGLNWKRVVLRVALVAWGLWAIYIAVLYLTLLPLRVPEWVGWLDDNLWFLVRLTGLKEYGVALVLAGVVPAAFFGRNIGRAGSPATRGRSTR